MRDLKRIIGLVLVCTLIVSSWSVVSAAANRTDAEIVESLNMLRGDGHGVTDEYLAKETTRIQAAIMFLRLKGLENEALYYTGTENFADADTLDWARGRAILAYLKAHPELGWIGDGKGFSPLKHINAKEYYKVMLEALGYKQDVDFTWSEVLSFAHAKGLNKAAYVDKFRNRHIATATVEALKANSKSGDMLVEILIKDGALDRDLVKALDFVELPPEGIMEEAKALDSTTIKVAFDKALSADEDDFSISSVNSSYSNPSIIDMDSADGGKVAILKVSEMKVGYRYVIHYGDKTETIVPTIKEDTTKPKIEKAEAITGALLKVTMDTRNINQDTLSADKFTINNDAYITTVRIDDEAMKVAGNENKTVLLMDVGGLKTGKAFTIKSTGVESYKGLVADSDDSKAIFAGRDADTKAPKLAGAVSEAGYMVIVTFLEDGLLDEASATDISNYSISHDISVIDAKIDKNVIGGETKVILTTSYQKSGIAYTLKASHISDGINVMKDTEKTIFAGKNKPDYQVATGAVSRDATKVEVIFEYAANDTALDINNYSIDNDINVLSAEFKEDIEKADKIDRKRVILTTSEMRSGKAYNLTVRTGVEDMLGQGLKDSKKLVFAGKDPDKSFSTSNYAEAIDNTKVRVTFGEEVDRSTATSVEHYYIPDLGYPSSVSLDSTGKIATLYVQEQKSGKAYEVRINHVKDLAGNVIKSDTQLPFTGKGEVTDRLKVTGATALSKTKIKVDINQALSSSSVIDRSKIILRSTSSSETYTITNATIIDGENVVLLDVGTNNLSSNKVYKLTFETGVGILSKYTYHTFVNTSLSDRESIFVGSDDDKAGFAIDYVTAIDETHVKVYFTEKLHVTASHVNLSIFTNDGYSTKATDESGRVIAYHQSTSIVKDSDRSVIFTLPYALRDNTVYYLEFDNIINFKSTTAELKPYQSGASTARQLFVTGELEAAADRKLDIVSATMFDKNTLEIMFNMNTNRDLTPSEVILVNNPSDSANPAGLQVGYVNFIDNQTARIYFTGEEKLNNTSGIQYVKIIGTVTPLIGPAVPFGSNQNYEYFAKNSQENVKPHIAYIEPQSNHVVKVTLNEEAYRSTARNPIESTDIVIYNDTTNIVIDPSHYTLVHVTGTGSNRIFYVQLDDGVFVSGANYRIGLKGNVVGIDGYVSADAYVPTSSETNNSRHFGGSAPSVTKISLSDVANKLLITGGSDSQDDTIEMKAGLGLSNSRDYVIGFSSSNNSLNVRQMSFETAADGSLADQVITGQDQKGITGQTTQIMIYDTAGNALLNSSVTITLQAGSIPAEVPATAAFTDNDNNANELGGPVTWTGAANESNITHYGVFFLNSDDSRGSQIGTDVAKGATYSVTIPNNTAIPTGTTKLAVFSKNGKGYAASGKEIIITDNMSGELPTLLARNVAFNDVDTNAGQIGGNITWDAATDESIITHYEIYYTNGSGGKVALIQEVAKGASPYSLNIVNDTVPPVGANTIAVYSKNGNGLSASAATVGIVDNDSGDVPTALATNVAFTDSDTNAGEVGGNVTWDAATDESKITHYEVYFVDGSGAKVGASIQEVAKGASPYTMNISNDTTIPTGASAIAVFSKNANGLSAASAKVNIVDNDSGDVPTAVPVTVSFMDTDGNAGEIGGMVTWTPPVDESKITHYGVFYMNTDDSRGAQIGADVIKGLVSTYKVTITANTAIPTDANRIVVYAKNSNGYSTTGKVVNIVDNNTLDTAVAQSINFLDTDPQLDEISGQVTWTAATDEANITSYGLYFVKADGQQGAQIGADVNKGATYSINVPVNTAIPTGSYKIAIYAKNGSEASATGREIEAVQLAKSPTFTDTDNTANEIGGTISFTKADDESNIAHYAAYFIDDSDVLGDKIGEVAVGGSNQIAVPVDTAIPANTKRIAIYSENGADQSSAGRIITFIDVQ